MSDMKVQANASTKISTGLAKKSVKEQLPFGVLLLVGMIFFGIYLGNVSPKLGVFWMIGICFGIVLEKSRFCFTASVRDPYLIGSTTITKALLIAFAITSIGFTAIKYNYYIRGLKIPGETFIIPISLATAIGAFLFGIGMVISGGCASGTLMRVGEGLLMQTLSLIFFVVGSLWGAHDFGWWNTHFIEKGKKIFLPDLFGWFGAIALQLLLIAILYMLADKWEERKKEEF